jgi:enoyl-CoA hydratase/carnithine racemase
MGPVSAVAAHLLDPLRSAVVAKAKGAVLGDAQESALRAALRGAAEATCARLPSIAHLSIDLLADDTVVTEVVDAATGQGDAKWSAADTRWRGLYETEPPDALGAFLLDLATELERRLRGNRDLQPLFLIGRTDVLVEGQDRLLTGNETLISTVSDLVERTAALNDPVRAIRQDDKIGDDLFHGSEVLGHVMSKIAAGRVGRALDIEASLAQGAPSFRLNPRPGTKVEMTLTKTVPNTPEGRAQLEALRAAQERNEDLDISDAQVDLLIDGVPVGFAGPVHALSRSARRRQRALLEFRTRGLKPERFLLDLDTYTAPDGGLRGESPEDTVAPLLIDLTIGQGGKSRLSYRGNPAGVSVRRQLKMARLGRHLKRGCRFEVWFAELDVSITGNLTPQAGWEDSDRAATAFALFDELQRRLGVDVGVIEELTALDLAYLRMGKRLLDRGRARWPFRGGTFTAHSTSETLNVGRVATGRGWVTVRYIRDDTLPLSKHPLPLGHTRTTFRLLWPPPKGHAVEDGLFEIPLIVDPKTWIQIERIAAEPSEP